MIQEYLNSQFIKTTDDTNFEKLKKASAELAKQIIKDPHKVFTISLIAFDPEIPADNNEIAAIKELIVEHWPTFSNSNDTQLTVIRAVALEALKIVSESSSNALLIWFACRNIYKHLKLGREHKILTGFLLPLANKLEKEVSEQWEFSPDYEIDTPKISAASVDPTEMTNNVNNGAGMAEAINKALKKQVAELKENQKKFAALTSLMQVRTRLLWWKEAAYSSSTDKSYKELDSGLLQVVLALDYADIIPTMYPRSIDYFLIEVCKQLSPNSGTKIKVSDFLKLVEKNTGELKELLNEYTENDSRITLGNFIQGFVHNKFEAKEFKNLVGLADTNELTYCDLTLWLFHDFHASNILNS